MAAETYLFKRIKFREIQFLICELPIQSKMGSDSKSKFEYTLSRAMAAMATMHGRRRHLSTLLTLLIFHRLIPNLARWKICMNSTYLASLRGIGPEEHEFFNDEVPSIVSYSKIGPLFLTM